MECGLVSVLSNCESGSGASLGAPLVGYPSDRVPTAHALAQAWAGGSRSLTGQGLGNEIPPSDRRHMCSEAFLRICRS